MGCGGSPSDWTEGITKLLKEENIMTPLDEWYMMTTTGGRKELVMPLPPVGVNLGKLAIWKLKFGDCSWWSDYRVNYYAQHGAERPAEAVDMVEANDMDEIDEYEEEIWEDV